MADASKPAKKKSNEGETALEPGAIVAGKYRVDRVLGEGGMGVVYAATHLALDQKVAIKTLYTDVLDDAQAVERFAREGRAAARIKSDHVVRVYDVGVLDGGNPYMVMEHLEGADLADLLFEAESIPIEEGVEYVLQACEGLAEAHKAGIIHRDLKPANLYVSRRADGSPTVKLLDFGISKFTVHPDDPSLDPSMTATATVMGSPGYMSPEQLKSARMVDERTDVWALGTILYEVVTGKPAFRGDSMPMLCAMIASEDPVLPSALRPDVPIGLEHAILRCLEKKPERRFQSVAEVARAIAEFAPERARGAAARIEGLLGGRPAIAVAPSVAPPSVRPAPKVNTGGVGTARTVGSPSGARRARSRAAAIAGLLAIVAGAVAVGVYVGRTNPGGVLPSAASASSAASSDEALASSASASPSAEGAAVDDGDAADDDAGDDEAGEEDDDAAPSSRVPLAHSPVWHPPRIVPRRVKPTRPKTWKRR